MNVRGNTVLTVVLASLALGAIEPVRAFEWPSRWKAPVCARCSQPLGRHYFPASGEGGGSGDGVYHPGCKPVPTRIPYDGNVPGTIPFGIPAPAVAAPPSDVAPPGEPSPVGPSTTPGMLSQNAADAATPPGGAATGADAAANAFSAAENTPAGAQSSGLGGAIGAPQGALTMFGDLSPFASTQVSARQGGSFRPPSPPEPPANRPTGLGQSTIFNPIIRSFKIADNQTAMPVNRFSFSYNYFDYVNQSVNQRLNVPIDRIQAMRYVFGFEKMFLDGRASLGMRLPLNNLVGNSNVSGLGQSSTSLGDLSAYFKYALLIDREWGRVLTAGMAVTMPTGPSTFAGAPWARGIHYTYLQPFVAFQYTWDRVYAIGFTSVEVPTSQRDALMIYNDLGLGYYLYRNTDPNSKALIKSIAPTFEVHVNSPTNHRDVFNRNDIAGTAEVVDLTTGINVFLGRRTSLSIGVVDPVTGPRPFSLEALALMNVSY